MSDRHLEEEEPAPLRTTPQGTQEEGVDVGHEEKDISFKPLFGWFGALGATVLVVVILLYFVFDLWTRSAEQKDVLPSPVFAHEQAPPPPRILPNPTNSGPLDVALQHPPESLPGEELKENQAAEKLGLQDAATGLPRVPEQAAAAVIAALEKGPRPPAGFGQEPVPGTTGTGQPLPSESSGGTRLENGLQ